MPKDIGCLRELPPDLAYLAEPAMKYGVHQFDDDIDRFLANVTDAELAELAALAERVKTNDHYPAVNDWLDEHKIDEHEEASNLYFLFGVMDAAGIEFDSA